MQTEPISKITNEKKDKASGIYRFLMKGIFDAYVLWPFDKKLISWLVTHIRTRNFTVA